MGNAINLSGLGGSSIPNTFEITLTQDYGASGYNPLTTLKSSVIVPLIESKTSNWKCFVAIKETQSLNDADFICMMCPNGTDASASAGVTYRWRSSNVVQETGITNTSRLYEGDKLIIAYV